MCEFDTPIVHHGSKLLQHGRASGGQLIYVKKCISKFFKHIGNFDCVIVLEIMEELLGQPVIYIACYLPPDRSKFYNSLQIDGVSILEQKKNKKKMLCGIKAIYPDHLFIVSGDLNARTKDQDDFIFDDSANYLPLPAFYSSDSSCMSRNSKDLNGELNEHGKQLLKFVLHI